LIGCPLGQPGAHHRTPVRSCPWGGGTGDSAYGSNGDAVHRGLGGRTRPGDQLRGHHSQCRAGRRSIRDQRRRRGKRMGHRGTPDGERHAGGRPSR
jgi:hypothetical protein